MSASPNDPSHVTGLRVHAPNVDPCRAAAATRDARPGPRLQDVELPIIPEIASLVRRNPGTLSLGQGVVGYLPPVDILRALEPLTRNPELSRYQAVSGMPALIEALKVKLIHENGFGADAFGELDILVTAGSNMAILQALLVLTEPGDEVILQRPYYFNHEMAVRAIGCVPRLVDTDANHQPDIAAIEAAIGPRTRIVITVSPNNPSGAVIAPADLRSINRLCAERGLIHFSDEAYEYFTFGQTPHFSVAADPQSRGHTLSFFSFSKNFGMASWRIGYCLHPKQLSEAFFKVQDTNLICPPVASQLVATQAARLGRASVQPHLQRLSKVRNRVHARLGELEGLARFVPTEGAFYVLVELPAVPDQMAFNRTLIERHRVATIPGFAFGLDPAQANVQRLSFGALTTADMDEGIGRFIRGCREWYREKSGAA